MSGGGRKVGIGGGDAKVSITTGNDAGDSLVIAARMRSDSICLALQRDPTTDAPAAATVISCPTDTRVLGNPGSATFKSSGPQTWTADAIVITDIKDASWE